MELKRNPQGQAGPVRSERSRPTAPGRASPAQGTPNTGASLRPLSRLLHTMETQP